MEMEEAINSALATFAEKEHEFKIFMDGVSQWFATNPSFRKADVSIIHSVKSRLKDKEHLKRKLARRWGELGPIDGSNLFDKVTDLAGIRCFTCTRISLSVSTPKYYRRFKNWATGI